MNAICPNCNYKFEIEPKGMCKCSNCKMQLYLIKDFFNSDIKWLGTREEQWDYSNKCQVISRFENLGIVGDLDEVQQKILDQERGEGKFFGYITIKNFSITKNEILLEYDKTPESPFLVVERISKQILEKQHISDYMAIIQIFSMLSIAALYYKEIKAAYTYNKQYFKYQVIQAISSCGSSDNMYGRYYCDKNCCEKCKPLDQTIRSGADLQTDTLIPFRDCPYGVCRAFIGFKNIEIENL
jgi:hypothetical protein